MMPEPSRTSIRGVGHRKLLVALILAVWLTSAESDCCADSVPQTHVAERLFAHAGHVGSERFSGRSAPKYNLSIQNNQPWVAQTDMVGLGSSQFMSSLGQHTCRTGFLPTSRLRCSEDLVGSSESGHVQSDNAAELVGEIDCSIYDCELLSFHRDLDVAWPTLKEDAHGVFKRDNLLLLGVAAGLTLVIRAELDDDVRATTARHPERWNSSGALGTIGDVTVQVPVILGAYFYSLRTQDREFHDFNVTMISAFTITGISTLLIKAIVNSERPSVDWNNGQFGFPSYHAASNFCVAAVLDDYYGPRIGLPAYAFAGLVSWSRIDERDHDLSDVVFGAALG